MQNLKAPYCNLALEEEEMTLHDDAFHIYSVRKVFIKCFRQRIMITETLRVSATQNNQLKYTFSFLNGVASKVIGALILFSDHRLETSQEAPKFVLQSFKCFFSKNALTHILN